MLCGYRNRFAPAAIVYHAGSATTGSQYNAFKTKLAARNSIYLIYKNMPLFQVILNLPFLLTGFLIKTLFFIKKGLAKEYVCGLADGVRLSVSEQGKAQKVPFSSDRLVKYIRIQCALWCNLFKLFQK